MKTLAKVVGCLLACLVIFDIAGVAVVFVFDVLSFSSTGLYYVLWFVLGVFCGLFSYNFCGDLASASSEQMEDKPGTDWTSRDKSEMAGLVVIVTTGAILLSLSVPFYLYAWQYHLEPSGFVPDSFPLTVTYFVTVLASTIFAHTSMRPDKARSK